MPARRSFNLSHSDGLAVCAVTVEVEVGVDVERMRRVDDADSSWSDTSRPDERAPVPGAATAERLAAFFSTWTRKEAFVKAIGAGLNRELQSFEVEVSPRPRSRG